MTKTINKNYQTFLKSDYWQNVSSQVKQRDKSCQRCGSNERLNVHHKKYVKKYTEHQKLDQLVTLCEKCHKKEHVIDWILKQVKNTVESCLSKVSVIANRNFLLDKYLKTDTLLIASCFNELKSSGKIPDHVQIRFEFKKDRYFYEQNEQKQLTCYAVFTSYDLSDFSFLDEIED